MMEKARGRPRPLPSCHETSAPPRCAIRSGMLQAMPCKHALPETTRVGVDVKVIITPPSCIFHQ
jgi:hypothetical protein